MTVAAFYVEAESAVHEKIERREQIRALMADVHAGDLVLCDKIDRWSRDPEFTYRSIREILAAGASFYAVADACDPSTPEGDTMLNFRVMFAREEHKRIKLRMVGTRRLLRDAGYYVEGLPPMGYARSLPKGHKGAEKNVLAIEPKGAALVRRAFRLCVSGKSLLTIAVDLGLTRDRVHGVLHNRLYTGEMRDSRGEWIRGKHEPLIDADLFLRAQAAVEGRRLGGPRTSAGSVAETHDWILRDVAVCALCGGKMGAAYAGDKAARRHYYRCWHACTRRYVPVRSTEILVREMVLSRLLELRADIAEGAEPTRGPVVDYAGQLAKIQRRRDKFLEAFADDLLPRAELRVRMAKLDDERLKVEAAQQASARPEPLADAHTRRSLLAELRTMERAWRGAAPVLKREMVNALATSVRLAAGKTPVANWRSAQELAENQEGEDPVQGSSARTCSRQRGLYWLIRAEKAQVRVLQ